MSEVLLSFRGRPIRPADVVFLRELIAQNPALSRCQLSIKVCAAWQWVQPNGQLRGMHRKNSLSYKTLNGARVGDLFMSLINTCRLNGFNPFAYLMAIATHPDEVKARPQDWLPWNYPKAETLAEMLRDPTGPPAAARAGLPG